MALSDISASTAPRTNGGTPCGVCAALADLPPKSAAALRSLLANREWRFSSLAIALREDKDEPLDIDAKALSRHARGGCAAREKLR